MSAKPSFPEQCLDCKWHVRITGLVLGGIHRCRYANIRHDRPWLDVCTEIIKKNGGTCLWHEKEARDD